MTSPPTLKRQGRREPPTFLFDPVRTRAVKRLTAPSAAAKVLTLVAPPGYGKTVLMSQWHDGLCALGQRCLWLSLDDRDSRVTRLMDAIDAALDERTEPLHPTHALFQGEAPLAERIDALIERLHDLGQGFTLFIDNLHCCTDPALPRVLDGLVLHTPPALHLVLSSTQDIPFDQTTAQLRGLLTPIGPADLSFSTVEVGALLGPLLCDQIGHRGIEEVARRTEGWPAAVRMAQIILSQANDPIAALEGLSGTQAALSRLLQQQVFGAFPAPVQTFLLSVAPLRSFSLALCRDVFDFQDAAAHLNALLDRQAFLVPVDRQQQWFRLHGLFRDFLLQEAHRTLGSQQVEATLNRAALWCMRHEHWADAMGYALEAQRPDTAADLLERIAPRYVRDSGQAQQYLQWVDTLHRQGHDATPEGEYWYAWSLAFQRRHDEARRHCDRLLARIGPTPAAHAPDPANHLRRRVAILRTSIASLSDRLHEAHQGASTWLSSATGDDDPFNLTAAHCIEASHHTLSLQFVEARREIQAARETAALSRSDHASGWVATYAAVIGVLAGDYAQADHELSRVLAQTRLSPQHNLGLSDMVAMVSAKCAIEMGLAEDAQNLLELGLEGARIHGFLESTACGLDAAVKLWTGAAGERFAPDTLKDVAAAYPPRLASMLSCYVIRRLVTLNRFDDARQEAERIGLGLEHPGDLPSGNAAVQALYAATRLDLLIALGRYKAAEPLLEDAERSARDTQSAPQQVDLALMNATLAVRSANVMVAMRHVVRALKLAVPRRIVRPFQDRGPALATLLAETPQAAWGLTSDAEKRFMADVCRWAGVQQRHGDPVPAVPDVLPLAQLTAREVELLGCIDAGLSNQQIADRLSVSLTTVKWHLQNLYGKLNVRSRSAALARARTMAVLPR